MKNLVIIGAGGFGREVYWLARGSGFEIKGFLDNRKDILNGKSCECEVICSVEDYLIEENDVFACGISNPSDKKYYSDNISQKGGKFINIIHPTARLSGGIVFGQGIILADNVAISCDVNIGNFATLNGATIIGHDSKIGDFSHFNTYSIISGDVQIGESAVIHANAIILPKIKIGKNSVVGAGSVVLRDVPDNTTVFGVPAMPVRI